MRFLDFAWNDIIKSAFTKYVASAESGLVYIFA